MTDNEFRNAIYNSVRELTSISPRDINSIDVSTNNIYIKTSNRTYIVSVLEEEDVDTSVFDDDLHNY